MNKAAVSQIVAALGPEVIEAELNVSDHAIRAAKYKGFFSGRWFDAIEAMCAEAGIDCPRSAFNFVPRARKYRKQVSGNKKQVRKTCKNRLSEAEKACEQSLQKDGA